MELSGYDCSGHVRIQRVLNWRPQFPDLETIVDERVAAP
jgi:hypothetical protein